ncbi:MAG: M20/M25/M40 family metallo-hydrolase, partial [Planctomycetota bacterium]|nr:M20/M25/M40 family metallo-hydrolase [Planctomycetota bacterium]
IPRTATMGGTVRTLLPESRSRMRDRIASMAGAVAEGFGCATTLRWFPGYPVTNNVPELVDLVHAKIAESKGEDAVCPMEAPVMGAEDFSYYGEKVPACFFALGLCPEGMDMPNVHESTFDFNDLAIPLGVETMVRLALEPLA